MGNDCPDDSVHLFLGLSHELEVPLYFANYRITRSVGNAVG